MRQNKKYFNRLGLLSIIPLIMVLAVMFTGCAKFSLNPFAKADKGEFVTDEFGNVTFVKGESKGKKKSKDKEASLEIPGNIEKVAVVKTSKGTITFKFFEEDAPGTVENFQKLAEEDYYDNLTFHRVEPNFVIQGGDPSGDGTGGPGYMIKDEFNPRPHLEGTVAMAKTRAPDSAGSQFYICLKALPQLDGKYTVFGQVISGLEVIHEIEVGDRIESIEITEQSVPF